MPTTPSPAAATAPVGRTPARVCRAVLSLQVLAATVAGLPLLLAWATPVIWAAAHDDMAHLLDRQDTGSAFLLVLLAVGWTGWAQFTFCTVREVIAQARGRTWHAPRGMGAAQRAAALLIGSVLVLMPTSSALASDAQAAPAATAAPVPGQAQTPQTTHDQQIHTLAASTSASRTTYTVREARPADSLWGIAERELGDGERWREIADLNKGRTMADGTVFRANSFLQPGWQLRMPETPTATAGARTQLSDSAPAAGEEGGHTVTVHPGDYLSQIAEEELGDGAAWPRLFEASRDTPQPHDLPAITDPDVIYAGQQVTVPGAQPDQPPPDSKQRQKPGRRETTPPATQDPDGKQQKPGDGTDKTQVPAPSQTPAPAPRSSAPSAPSRHPAERPGREQTSPSTAASATPHRNVSTSPTDTSPPTPAAPSAASPAATASASPATAPPARSPLTLRTALGAGALLAAAVTGALALRRTLQRRRREPGETIAIAAISPAEAQLAAAAEPDGAARLDVALRTLAHQAQQDNDAAVPPLWAARLGTRTVEVLPEDLAHQPPAPFVAGHDGWWKLDPEAALLQEDRAREVPAPYPGLITIGPTHGGDLLLLNLAQLPALLLAGDPGHVTEVCACLALEFAMSPWANEIEVVVVGFGEDLPHLLPTARIAHLRQPAHALRDLSERLLEAHQTPEERQQPYLLLCASLLGPDLAWQFADILDRAAGAVPVMLVAPASMTAPHFPQAPVLNASLNDPQHLDPVGTDITLQRLEHAAYQQIITALKVSGQPAHPAQGPWQDVPDEPDSTQPPAPEKPAAPSTAPAPEPAPLAAPDTDVEVFPALLAATADPAGLRLLPTTAPPHTDHAGPGPDLETAAPTAPAVAAGSPAASRAAAAEDADSHRNADMKPTTSDTHGAAQDLHAPEIRVLGPVQVTGVNTIGHGPRMAQLAALLYLRPGRTADVLCADMDPAHPWSRATLNTRLQNLRSALGSDPAGNPYVPRRRTAEDPYRLAPGVRCDWTRFLQLVEPALPLGPVGLPELEEALTLVRGRPFGGRPMPWAQPHQQDMTTRIIDVAHTVATHRTPLGPHHDLRAARQAVATGLDADDTSELLYRDSLRIEHTAGNRQGVHAVITRIQQVNRALDCSPEPATEQLIHELLNGNTPGAVVRRVV
ncbi:hypothetical protein GCM10010129_76450 [Streptomyces fumigatiscleroticus]|nr:hypothetical protein GCM10010129_76450 [Streptomyces fumigatiscleroticus]